MEEKRKDIRFLEFLEPEDGIIKGEVKIASFMINNFIKPDPLSDLTTNENDNGIFFLQDLSDRKLIRIHMETIKQVNSWLYPIGNKNYKHWFDTQEHTANITKDGLNYLYQHRNNQILLETSISTTKTNRAVQKNITAQIIFGVISTLAILLTAIYAICAYYKSESENLILIRKSMKQQELLLQSMQQSQKGIDTSLKIIAKKTSTKK